MAVLENPPEYSLPIEHEEEEEEDLTAAAAAGVPVLLGNRGLGAFGAFGRQSKKEIIRRGERHRERRHNQAISSST